MRRMAEMRAARSSMALGALALVLIGCGGQAAPEPAEGEPPSGFLRPAEPALAEVLAAERSDSAPAAEPTPAPAPVVPASEPPVAQPVAPAARAAAPRSASDEVELAAALLHDPEPEFVARLEGMAGLEEPRRLFLLALAAARAGEPARAAELARGLDASDALAPAERELLARALEPEVARPIPASFSGAAPLARALEIAHVEREALADAARGAHASAAAGWSRILLAEVSSPWPADAPALAHWSEALALAQREHRWSPRGDWPSIEVVVRSGDSLIAIRKRVLAEHPDLLLSTGLIARANGLPDEEAIRPDDVLRIPTDRARALVDLGARWTFYLLGDEVAAAWEVGIGKEEGATPVGGYTVTLKQEDPMLFQPGKPPIPFGDPENPLGTRWMEWGQDGKGTHLGFHGTDDPSGIGGRVSRGCVRMRNADVELLYDILPLGATVTVQP